MRDSVLFYRSFWEAVKELPPEQFKESVKAIMEYGLNEKEPETTGIEKTVYHMAKPQIDANNRRYQNGTKGGRPATEKEPTCNQTITKKEPSHNLTLTKQEPKVKDKDKDKVKDNKTYSVRFAEIWDAYPRKKEKAAAYAAYNARLNDGFSEDELMTAVKRYAESCNVLKTEDRYIKHGSTFFGPNTPFIDYVGDDYKPPKRTDKPKSGFHNLEEHGYDYDKMVWGMMNKQEVPDGEE